MVANIGTKIRGWASSFHRWLTEGYPDGGLTPDIPVEKKIEPLNILILVDSISYTGVNPSQLQQTYERMGHRVIMATPERALTGHRFDLVIDGVRYTHHPNMPDWFDYIRTIMNRDALIVKM